MSTVLAMAHSHSWFLTQTCLQSLRDAPPEFAAQVVVVDNSWDSSPSILGITETGLGEDVMVVNNHLAIRAHGGAYDLVVEQFKPDFFMSWETDVTAVRPGWLRAFWDMMRPTDFAAGVWHEREQYVYMSCCLYRGSVLQDMAKWSRDYDSKELRWGTNFEKAELMPESDYRNRTSPFGERRGWPAGTRLKIPTAHQQTGAGWVEPGQALFSWAVEAGHTYSVMPSWTEHGGHDGTIPVGTFCGSVGSPWCVHWWCGTRALTTMFVPDGNQDFTDPWLQQNREMILRREAKQWLERVPKSIRDKTLSMIRRYGWRLGKVTEANHRAVADAERIYREAGVPL